MSNCAGCCDCRFYGDDYVNAPATRMLAINCAVCGRPLVDSISVETGIGPECRKKYRYNVVVPEEVRAEANQIVHAIAVEQEGLTVAQAANRLRGLGFAKLAETILRRVSDVTIFDAGDGYRVTFRFNADAVDDLRRVPGRRWFPKPEKLWFVPYSSRRELFEWLRRNFQGAVIMGPKGPFVV